MFQHPQGPVFPTSPVCLSVCPVIANLKTLAQLEIPEMEAKSKKSRAVSLGHGRWPGGWLCSERSKLNVPKCPLFPTHKISNKLLRVIVPSKNAHTHPGLTSSECVCLPEPPRAVTSACDDLCLREQCSLCRLWAPAFYCGPCRLRQLCDDAPK